MRPTLIEAVVSLVPDAQVTCCKNTIEWHNYQTAPVTEQEITTELIRLQQEYDNKEYQRFRAAEYPPMADYLDGVVKGDQAQIDKYVADCLAVKVKYPKVSEFN